MKDFNKMIEEYDALPCGGVYMDNKNEFWLKPSQEDIYHLDDNFISMTDGRIVHLARVMDDDYFDY